MSVISQKEVAVGNDETSTGTPANSFSAMLLNLVNNLESYPDNCELVIQADGSGRIQTWKGSWVIGFNNIDDMTTKLNNLTKTAQLDNILSPVLN
jgi:hypothetical protein